MNSPDTPSTHHEPNEPNEPVIASIIVVSFNTRDLLERCLQQACAAANGLQAQIIVVDNASWDGSADMVAQKFPEVELVRAPHNLGFAAANNLGWQQAHGKYVVLLNPDAFLASDTLTQAVRLMAVDTTVALAGGLLVSRNGEHEPSARQFPSVLNDLLTLSGLADRFPRSRFFGRFNRTWADPQQPAYVDWVPGAFAIIRNSVLQEIGFFDERFFLYFEEVDLCRRIGNAGHRVAYWPELKITHFGGESSRTLTGQSFSANGRQLTLWRMRSMLLYYRKHHGMMLAWLASNAEKAWHWLRAFKNRGQTEKFNASREIVAHMRRAWCETLGGRVSPPRPW